MTDAEKIKKMVDRIDNCRNPIADLFKYTAIMSLFPEMVTHFANVSFELLNAIRIANGEEEVSYEEAVKIGKKIYDENFASLPPPGSVQN